MTKAAVAKAWGLTPVSGRRYSDPGNEPGGGGGEDFLYIGNPITSPIALTRIYPLSNSELTALSGSGSAHWYQSKAEAGVRWELPLGWMGGTYPYNFTLTTTTDAEIVYTGRDTLAPPFRESLVWENPTVGTHEFTIEIEDQLGEVDEVTFTLTVYATGNTTHFMWIDPTGGNNSNSGTRASPKQTFMGWYGANEDDSTHANKIIYYEDSGSTPLTIGGLSGASYDGSFSQRFALNNSKPKVHVFVDTVAIHGNGAYFQLDAGQGWTFTGPAVHSDMSVQEANTVPLEDGLRTQGIKAGNAAYQYGFIGCGYTFLGPDPEPGSGSNSSCIELSTTLGGAPSPYEGYFFPGIVMDSMADISGLKNNNGMGILCAGWIVRDCSSSLIIHHKSGQIERTEDRGFAAYENNSDCQFHDVEWINDPISRVDNTVCWNNVKMTGSGNGGLRWLNGNAPAADTFTRQYGWRNNMMGANHNSDANSGDFRFTYDLTRYSSGSAVVETGAATLTENNHVKATTGLFDATTNLLTGADRTSYLGTHGCEMTVAV